MRFAIIWTWLEPDDTGKLEPKQKVGYFCTLAEAQAEFDSHTFGEKELVCILETRGVLPAEHFAKEVG
jgi:hypothetical protein